MAKKSVIHSGKRNDRHLSGNIGNRACRTPFPIFATQLTQAFSGNHRMNARGHFDQTKGSSRRLPVRGYGTSASRTAEAIFGIVHIAVRIEVGAVEPLLRERDLIRKRLEQITGVSVPDNPCTSSLRKIETSVSPRLEWLEVIDAGASRRPFAEHLRMSELYS
jgi:hypothetical protein